MVRKKQKGRPDAHTSKCHCDDFVLLTASGLVKKKKKKIVLCKLYHFARVYNLSFNKPVTLYQMNRFWTRPN